MTNLLHSIFLLSIFVFDFTVADEIIYAQLGDTVQLNPHWDSNDYFYWKFGNDQIATLNRFDTPDFTTEWKNRLTFNKKMLQIKNITQQDFGKFNCEVKNSNMIRIKSKFYHVVKLSVTVNSRIVLPEEQVSLTCSVQTPPSAPEIYWLSPQGTKMDKGGNLNFKATTSHRGQWTCVVPNKETKINVSVIDLLPTASHTQYSSKSTHLSIPCSLPTDISWGHLKNKGVQEVGWYFCPSPATICNKSPLFSVSLDDEPTWKIEKVGTIQAASNPRTGNLSLVSKLGREENRGDYVCFMKFKNGVILNRTVHVELLHIMASPGTELIEGQLLNLTCTTGGVLPSDLRVKWVPPKASLYYTLPHVLQSPHLTIPEVGREDKGKWMCELWRGETQLTSAEVALNIERKISVWLLVTLCGAVVILVLLMILVFMLHRRKQRRIRRLKLKNRLCHCKNPKPKGFYRT